MTDDLAKIRRIALVAQAFTPGGPINQLRLFQGRTSQIQDVASAVVQAGQHVALYGERGVGKTSLANIIAELFEASDLPQIRAARVNCNSDDSFADLWRNIYRELDIPHDGIPLSPEDVRYTLARESVPAVIVIDELDRFDDDESLSLLADLIKSLSDHNVPSTLVMVGVAESIDELMGEHESIARSLVKVRMPRMSRRELIQILEEGWPRAGLTATEEAEARITILSRGLPHFTHLLALHAGQRAVQNDRSEVTLADVNASIPTAVSKHVVEGDYLRAVRTSHSDTLYRPVLVACALAPQDQFGYFPAGAVREPLRVIAGRRIEIPQFARHLSQFLESDRGSPLQRIGVKRRYVYRFRDPILQTYAILRGVADGIVPDDMLKYLLAAQPMPDEPTEPEQLF